MLGFAFCLFFFPRFFVPSSQHLLVWGSDNTKYQEWRCVNPFVVAWLQCGDQQKKKKISPPPGVFLQVTKLLGGVVYPHSISMEKKPEGFDCAEREKCFYN